MISEILFSTLAGLLVMGTVLSEVRVDVWWIRVLDFPRNQIAVLAILTALVGGWILGPWSVWAITVVGSLTAVAVYQVVRIFPHLPVAPVEVLDATATDDSVAISVLTANVLQSNRNADQFLDLVREYDPDLVLAIETNRWWDEQLRVLEDAYPFGARYPLDTTYGMIVYSRVELVDPEIQFLVDDDIPSIHTRLRLANGVQVWLHAIHPDPPNPRYATETTERDAELLLVGREVKKHGGPTIVIGDFNDVAWSHTTRLFRDISGLLDPRVGRGFYNTFHADFPLLRWPVDHVFHSDHFRLSCLERGRHFGSDHLPVYAELVLDPKASHIQDQPSADDEEKQEAKEKIEDANAEDGSPAPASRGDAEDSS